MNDEFDPSPYSPIREALLKANVKCGVNSRHQVSVSIQDGSIWPDRGNSFWITCATGEWNLFTWLGRGYEIPDSSRVVGLCIECMQIDGSAMYSVPDDIVIEFSLRLLTEANAELVFAAMATAE
ncbi:MAG: hypothetical protein ACI814_003655 [Mariniblastus sp.]|jgi:hypothetical protein